MKKVKITTWVDERVAKVIMSRVETKNSTVSNVAADMLKLAVRGDFASIGVDEKIMEMFGEAVNRSMQEVANDLASLVSNGALYAIAGRLELGALLVKEFGEPASQKICNDAWKKAIEQVRAPLEG